jgi:hypothetical protein
MKLRRGSCHIVVVEWQTSIDAAWKTAVNLGATFVTNSLGYGERSIDGQAAWFNSASFFASGGDYGFVRTRAACTSPRRSRARRPARAASCPTAAAAPSTAARAPGSLQCPKGSSDRGGYCCRCHGTTCM